MKIRPLLYSAALSCPVISLHADSWFLTDGTTFEAKVRLVTPDLVIFSSENSLEKAVATSKLTEESRLRLAGALGLTMKPSQPSAPPLTEPAPKVVPSNHPGRDPKAMDATQVDLIDSQYGLTGKVVGIVKEVLTLGKTGHVKLTFEGTEFNVFISKRFLEKSSGWKLEGLSGKTVQITGEIAKYQEVVQIALKEPSQIQVLP